MERKKHPNIFLMYVFCAVFSTILGTLMNAYISAHEKNKIILNNAQVYTKQLDYWRECEITSLRDNLTELGVRRFFFSCKWEV